MELILKQITIIIKSQTDHPPLLAMQPGYSTRRSDLYSSSHQSIGKSQHRPLMCRFHPNNDLHTFCMSPQCLLPMCSTCIGIHNEDHRQARSHGNYTDLNQLLKETLSTIQQQQSALEELSSEYVEDYSSKKNIREVCKQNLIKARAKIHEQLDRIFDRITLDIQEKVDNFEEELHRLYNQLQNRIHQSYKLLTKQKQDLTKSSNDLTRSTSVNSLNMTKRTNMQNFTPNQTGINYETRKGQDNYQQHKKQDHRILKTLIQFYSQNLSEVNRNKINKLKLETSQLKQIDLIIQMDYQKINKNMKTICTNSIEIKSKSNKGDNINRNTQKQIKSMQSMQSQSNISQNGRRMGMNEMYNQHNDNMFRKHLQQSRQGQQSSYGHQRSPPVKDRSQKVNITYHNYEGL